MKRKSFIFAGIIVIIAAVIGILFAVNRHEKKPTIVESDKGDTELLFSFESYEDITGTSIYFNSLFGETAINTDESYITDGKGSWLVKPEGDYGKEDEYPKFRMRCVDTTFKKSDFNAYDKIMLDIYNASDKEVAIEWSFTTRNNSDVDTETEKNVYHLKPNGWTTCEYDLTDESYGAYFRLDMVKRMNVTFLTKKMSKDDVVPELYFDNLRGHFAENEREIAEWEYDFAEGITFEKSTDFYLFSNTVSETMQMDLERIAYADTALTEIDEALGEYALVGRAAGATWPAVTVNFGETVKKDMILSFQLYVEVDEELAGDSKYRVEAFKSIDEKVAHGFLERKNNAFNQWVQVDVVLKHDHNTAWIFLNFDDGNGHSIFAPDVPVNVYMDNFVLSEKKQDVIVDDNGNVTLLNPYNVKDLTYRVDKPAKKGQIISFDIDFNMSDAVAVWVLGDDEWKDEWYAEGFTAWGGKKHIQVEVGSDTEFFSIYVQYRGEHKQYQDYECKIQNIKILNEYVFDDIVMNNPGNEEVLGYTFSRSVKKGQHITFDINVSPKQPMSVWVLGDDMWKEEYYAQAFPKWTGKKTISANVTEDTENFTVYVKFLDGSGDYKNNVVTISNMSVGEGFVNDNPDLIVKENGDVILKNNPGSSQVLYTFEKPVKAGQIVQFDIDVDPAQYIAVWLLGDDMWKDEYFAKPYEKWTGKQTVKVTVPEDTTNFTVNVEFRDDSFDFTENVITISNVIIKEPDVKIDADGTINVENSEGNKRVSYIFNKPIQKGQMLSFDLEVTPSQKVALWVLDEKDQEYIGEEFSAWNGSKSFSTIIYETTKRFTILLEYRGDTELSDNVLTIRNVKIGEPEIIEPDVTVGEDGTVTIKNSDGNRTISHTFQQEVSTGQTVSFDLSVNPSQPIAVWLLTDYNEYIGEVFTFEGSKTFKANIVQNSTKFKIQVRYDGDTPYEDNVLTISNVKVADPDVVVGEDGSVTIQNSSGYNYVEHQFIQDVKAGQRISFDLEVTPSQSVAVRAFAWYEHLSGTFEMIEGKTTFVTDAFSKDADNFKIQVKFDGSVPYEDNVVKISNVQILEPDVTVEEDGTVTLRNSSGERTVKYTFNQELKAGQTIKFDLAVNPSQQVAVWLLTDYEEHIANTFTWDGAKTFTATLGQDTSKFKVQVRYDGEAPYDENVLTISNVKIIEPDVTVGEDGTVTLRNSSGERIVKHTFEQEVKAGQTIKFDLAVNPSQQVAVWLLTDYEEHIANTFTWDGTKTFTVTLGQDTSKFKVQVRYDGETPYDENVLTISNVKILEPDVVVEDDGSVTLRNSTGKDRVEHQFIKDVKVGQTVSFDMEIEADSEVTIYLFAWGEYIGQTFGPWEGTKNFTATFSVNDADNFRIQVRYSDSDSYEDNIVRISNVKIIEPDVTVGDDGTVTLRNSSGERTVKYTFNQEVKAGQTIKFDLAVNPSQQVAVWLLTDYEEHIANTFTWDGVKSFEATIGRDTTAFKIQVRYDGEAPYESNVLTISNVQIESKGVVLDDVVIENPNGVRTVSRQFIQDVKAGETIIFDLEVEPNQQVAVWLLAWNEYIANTYTWEGKKTFAVTMQKDTDNFKIQIRYDGEAPYSDNVTKISNIRILPKE